MGFKKFIAIILFMPFLAFAEVKVKSDALVLRETTIPTTGKSGELRFGTTTQDLQYKDDNTWLGVVTALETGINVCYVSITLSAGSPSIGFGGDNCVTSVDDDGVGDFGINFAANTFGGQPICLGTATSLDNRVSNDSSSQSSCEVRVSNSSGAAADDTFRLLAIGPKQ